MKTRHLSIIPFALLLLVPVMMNHPVKAGCLGPDPDWPAAPCYGCPGCIPSLEKQREEWAPYYQYKGANWMEMMKTQMIEAMKNGTLEDWVTGKPSNYNVWRYYYVNNEAPFFRSSVSGLNNERPYFPPPLQQLTTGIAPKDVACKEGLDLVIRADGLPACVRYTTAYALVGRGWAKESVSTMTSLEPTVIIPTNSSTMSNGFTFAPQVVKTVFGLNNTVRWINMDSVANDIASHAGAFRSGPIKPGYAWTHTFDKAGTYGYHSVIHPWLKGVVTVIANPLASLKNDTGTVTVGNQTYYFETPVYSHDAYTNSPQVSLHDVTFTLFPSGFRGGLPSSCGEQYYWADAQFSDSTKELLHIFAGPKCPVLPPPTYFSTHANPQAGMAFYDGKMKLLVSAQNQTNPNLDEFDGVIIDQSLGAAHTYYFFTNYTSVKFNIGSEGIRLEGMDNTSGLDGKHVKIFGEIQTHQHGEDTIKMAKFQILGSFVPKSAPSGNMIEKVSFDDLLDNPDRYYNQTIAIAGQLREHDYQLGIAGVGCNSAEFTTSDKFVPDFISRHQLYNGERYIGVRIGGPEDVGYSSTDRLPADLKNKSVIVTGLFVPEVHDTGMCVHVLHKSGYILTDFSKITSIGG